MKKLANLLGAIVLAVAFFAALVLGQIGWSLLTRNTSDTTSQQNNNVVIIPSQTPQPHPITASVGQTAPTETPIPLPTDTPIPLPTNTLIPFKTNTPAPTLSLLNQWENTIAVTLALVTDVDVKSVRIVDGRTNGGERGLFIAFTAPSSEQTVAVGSIWGAAGGAIREYNMDIDAITLIYGVDENHATGLIVLQVSDLLSYLNGEITIEELVSRAN